MSDGENGNNQFEAQLTQNPSWMVGGANTGAHPGCLNLKFLQRSKLKFIKYYLCSSMSQERLSQLAILSIERELVKIVDFEIFVSDFVGKKGRKIMF